MDGLNSSLNEIYNRQSGIEDFSHSSAMVIGLGGVGSWIALDLALIGIGTLILIDDDKVEATNLNRTVFKYNQIGEFKTLAIKDLIKERRPSTIILPIEDRFQLQLLSKYNVDFIFDATDNLVTRDLIKESHLKNELEHQIPYCKCGYDGFFATISVNDFERGRWGEEGSYTTVPSFFGTPQILSAIAIIEMLLVENNKKYSRNFHVKNIIKNLKKHQ